MPWRRIPWRRIGRRRQQPADQQQPDGNRQRTRTAAQQMLLRGRLRIYIPDRGQPRQ
jgi:hypothetical protein